jgi:hypothetical protein
MARAAMRDSAARGQPACRGGGAELEADEHEAAVPDLVADRAAGQ